MYSLPSRHWIYVISVSHFRLGASAVKFRWIRFSAFCAAKSQIDLIKVGGYGGQSFPGLHDGVVSMSAFSEKVPADVAEKVNAVVEQVKSGTLVITPNYSEN